MLSIPQPAICLTGWLASCLPHPASELYPRIGQPTPHLNLHGIRKRTWSYCISLRTTLQDISTVYAGEWAF